ncbi:unnamed protein product, partial [Citrullus colocynthis]
MVETNFLDQLRKQAKTNTAYIKLLKKVEEGVVGRYWLEDGLMHTKGNRLYVPSG